MESISISTEKVVDKSIVTEGVYSNVSIFNVRRSLFHTNNTKVSFVSKTLNPGFYIIRFDNKSYKEVVK